MLTPSRPIGYRRGAFDLLSVLAAVAIGAIVMLVAIPKYSAYQAGLRDEAAKVKGRALVMAKDQVKSEVKGATAAYAAASDKYAYLKSNGATALTESTLAAFTPAGYSINPGAAITDDVVVTKADGTVLGL